MVRIRVIEGAVARFHASQVLGLSADLVEPRRHNLTRNADGTYTAERPVEFKGTQEVEVPSVPKGWDGRLVTVVGGAPEKRPVVLPAVVSPTVMSASHGGRKRR